MINARTIIRIALFWAAFCFAVLIGDLLLRGAFMATAGFSWPQILIALFLAILTEFVVLPRLPIDQSKR